MPRGREEACGTSCKKAFGELVAQVKKHQAKLRKDYEWKRNGRSKTLEALLNNEQRRW